MTRFGKRMSMWCHEYIIRYSNNHVCSAWGSVVWSGLETGTEKLGHSIEICGLWHNPVLTKVITRTHALIKMLHKFKDLFVIEMWLHIYQLKAKQSTQVKKISFNMNAKTSVILHIGQRRNPPHWDNCLTQWVWFSKMQERVWHYLLIEAWTDQWDNVGDFPTTNLKVSLYHT